MKQLNIREDNEIKNCERLGNFSLIIATIKSNKQDQRSKKNELISAIFIRRENSKIDSISKFRKESGMEALPYPQANKEIKKIKPKHRVKIVQIAL